MELFRLWVEMIRYRLRFYAYLALGLAIITWIALIPLPDGNLQITVTDFWNIPTAITINLFLWIVFIKWLWKWRLFYSWLVPFPNLSGKWTGEISSNWIDPATERTMPPTSAEVEIRQTFLNIYVMVKTEEMTSYSYVASFLIDNESGMKQLCYSYTSKPDMNIRKRSVIHDGTAILEIVGDPANLLKGEYWTGRGTTGEILLKRTMV